MGGDEVVSLAVVQNLLDVQANAFKNTLQLMVDGFKDDLKDLRKEVAEIKLSLQFSQSKFDDATLKMDVIEKRINSSEHDIKDSFDQIECMEDNLEYLENHSRRNNVKIFGIAEDKQTEKSWDDTEKVVKDTLSDKLGITDNLEIERCHRVGNPNKSQRGNKNSHFGSRNDDPRPIVVKFLKWKDKEKVLQMARSQKPENVKFVADYAKRTLDRRREKVPQLIEARKKGKIAYFVMDKLMIRDKPLEPSASSESEISFGPV